MIRQSAPSAKAAAAMPASAMPTGTKVPHSDRAKAWCRGSAMPAISEGGDDDQEIADAGQAARGEQRGAASAAAHKRRRRRHDQDAEAQARAP